MKRRLSNAAAALAALGVSPEPEMSRLEPSRPRSYDADSPTKHSPAAKLATAIAADEKRNRKRLKRLRDLEKRVAGEQRSRP